MKPVVREHIQQLDVSLGGGIVSDKIRVDTIDNPILIIGLGGTGIDALLRLKYQINRRFKLPEDPISKKKRDKPDNVEFLAFETNEQDRGKNTKALGWTRKMNLYCWRMPKSADCCRTAVSSIPILRIGCHLS